jgi:hypothetical protein
MGGIRAFKKGMLIGFNYHCPNLRTANERRSNSDQNKANNLHAASKPVSYSED